MKPRLFPDPSELAPESGEVPLVSSNIMIYRVTPVAIEIATDSAIYESRMADTPKKLHKPMEG